MLAHQFRSRDDMIRCSGGKIRLQKKCDRTVAIMYFIRLITTDGV
ncbi:MAG TPA: hypothetical protein V6D15_21250 [Oculatellaceae cyanobacterium]